MHFTAPQHRVKGFTLLELMIALAVAGILASIAVPSFSDFLARLQLRSDVNEVVSTLNIARSEAIRQRQIVEITIQDVTVCLDSLDACKDQDVTVSFDSLGTRNDCLPSCEDCSSSCQIILEAKKIGESRTLEVTPAGGIRLMKPTGDSHEG